MRQLGKKKGMQDGTLVAFACPCDCTATCTSTCSACAGMEGVYSLQRVEAGRALAYGGNSILNQLSGTM